MYTNIRGYATPSAPLANAQVSEIGRSGRGEYCEVEDDTPSCERDNWALDLVNDMTPRLLFECNDTLI